jgi:hypothetical protein
MDVLVPLDYPFDRRTPKKITLTCQQEHHMGPNQGLVGTVDLTDWKQDQPWPEGTIKSSEQQLVVTLAWGHCRAGRYDKVERMLATIEGRLGAEPVTLDRERIRLHMLLSQEKTGEALALVERLMPVLEDEYRRWKGRAPDAGVFAESLLALAYGGKIDELKASWKRIKSIHPERHRELNAAVRERIAESIQRSLDNCLRRIVPRISHRAHLTVDQLNDIFEIDIRKSELFHHCTFWDWNPKLDKPRYKNWERHLSELGEYYKTRPLPDTMELLKHDKKEEYAARMHKIPGAEGYLVELFNRPLKDYACFYHFPESAGRLRMEGEISDIELGHDLIYKEGVDQQQRIRWLLGQFGLEVVEVNEPRTVWIARHDGRELKDYKEVRAPVPCDASGKMKTGMMWTGSNGGFDFDYLFTHYMWWQNKDYRADCAIIIDETGITGPVSCEGPNWEGPEAPALARKWFKEEMGVTFTEETRTITAYVIRHNRQRAK